MRFYNSSPIVQLFKLLMLGLFFIVWIYLRLKQFNLLEKPDGSPQPEYPTADKRFIYLTFSLFAKIALSDKKVVTSEIDFIERFMQKDLKLASNQRVEAIDIFRKAKNTSRTVEQIVSDIKINFGHEPTLLANLFEVLVCLAIADGGISEEEDLVLKKTAEALSLKMQYELTKRRLNKYYFNNQAESQRKDTPKEQTIDPQDSYSILGIARSANEDEIKRAYRNLALEHHPDRLAAKGFPKEFTEVATRRFQIIQAAYDKICLERGLR